MKSNLSGAQRVMAMLRSLERHEGRRRSGGALWPRVVVGIAAILLASMTSRADAEEVTPSTEEGADMDTGVSFVVPTSTGEVPGHEERITHQTLLTTSERGCHEINIARAGDLAKMREAVPARYGLVALSPTAGRLRVLDYNCAVSVDNQQRTWRGSVTMVLAQIQARDGVPSSGFYLLSVGTDDPVLAARYAQLGLPAKYLPATSTSFTPGTGDAGASLEFNVVGDRLDHTIRAQATGSILPLGVGVTHVFHDSTRGDLRLTWFNESGVVRSAGTVIADYTGMPALVDLLLLPGLARINGATFPSAFVHDAAWTTTLELLDRP